MRKPKKKHVRYARLVLCDEKGRQKKKRKRKENERQTDNINSIHKDDDDYACCYSACRSDITTSLL